jgi:hypothetical protein
LANDKSIRLYLPSTKLVVRTPLFRNLRIKNKYLKMKEQYLYPENKEQFFKL